MKSTIYILLVLLWVVSCSPKNSETPVQESAEVAPAAMEEAQEAEDTKVLRHVVLFKFKEGTTAEEVAQVEEAFAALPDKISQIKAFEWGTNNSPEGLDKGFTHCFFLTFSSEEDRDDYLPHPDHAAFGEIVKPHLEDVLVVDYWTN